MTPDAPSPACTCEVEVRPSGVRLGVRVGETVIEAAWRLGYRWPTACWGQAQCGLCAMRVSAGAEHFSPVGEEEGHRLRELRPRHGGDVRLACRAVPTTAGAAVVHKGGVTALHG